MGERKKEKEREGEGVDHRYDKKTRSRIDREIGLSKTLFPSLNSLKESRATRSTDADGIISFQRGVTFFYRKERDHVRRRKGWIVLWKTVVIEFIEGDDRPISFHSLLFHPPLPVYLGSLATLELFVNASRPGIIYKSRGDPPRTRSSPGR